MVEYDLTKDDIVKENILQKKSIREGATVLYLNEKLNSSCGLSQ